MHCLHTSVPIAGDNTNSAVGQHVRVERTNVDVRD